jgi:hypothetical protein
MAARLSDIGIAGTAVGLHVAEHDVDGQPKPAGILRPHQFCHITKRRHDQSSWYSIPNSVVGLSGKSRWLRWNS